MNAQDMALAVLAKQRGLLEAYDPKLGSTRSLIGAGMLSSDQVHDLLRDLNRYAFVCQGCRLILSFNALEGLETLHCYACASPLAPEERTDLIPDGLLEGSTVTRTRTLGPYTLVEELGHGNFGGVYLGMRSGLERLFAIKVLRGNDPEALARFRLETAVAAKIHHPNVVGVYDAGRSGNNYYYVMEYCPGQTLAERLRRGPLHPREAADLVRHLAHGVEAAHAAGVLHRDLKPANIILARGSGLPRITDFGLARDPTLLTSLTQSGDTVGTPYYMSPEQLMGEREKTDERSDVFALGVVLFECLTGKLPVVANDMNELAHKLLKERRPLPTHLDPSLPRALDGICRRATTIDPADRTPSAEALAAELTAFLSGATLDLEEPPPRWPRSALVAVGLLALAVGILLPVAVLRGRGQPAAVASATPGVPQATPATTPTPASFPPPIPTAAPAPAPSTEATPADLLLGPVNPKGSRERVLERETLVKVYMERPTDERIVIKDPRVLAAMRRVPRHSFLAPEMARYAYTDAPVRHYRKQSVSQPHTIALMTQLLALKPDDKVLEIGTGSGYHAAILSHLCWNVFSLEIDEDLATRAAKTLRDQGYRRVRIRNRDGFDGWPDEAPFDAILITCGAPFIPKPLWDQLKVGGRVVLPHGKRTNQSLVVVTKSADGKAEKRVVMPVRFTPMRGKVVQVGKKQKKKKKKKPGKTSVTKTGGKTAGD